MALVGLQASAFRASQTFTVSRRLRGHEFSVRVKSTAIYLVPVARQASRGPPFSQIINSSGTTFAATQHVRLVVVNLDT